jgi:hypothetical protein
LPQESQLSHSLEVPESHGSKVALQSFLTRLSVPFLGFLPLLPITTQAHGEEGWGEEDLWVTSVTANNHFSLSFLRKQESIFLDSRFLNLSGTSFTGMRES